MSKTAQFLRHMHSKFWKSANMPQNLFSNKSKMKFQIRSQQNSHACVRLCSAKKLFIVSISEVWEWPRDGLNIRRPTPRSSAFWVARNLSHHMYRQTRTGDTVLVKLRVEIWQEGPKHCRGGWGPGGEGVKTTENKKILATLNKFCPTCFTP